MSALTPPEARPAWRAETARHTEHDVSVFIGWTYGTGIVDWEISCTACGLVDKAGLRTLAIERAEHHARENRGKLTTLQCYSRRAAYDMDEPCR